MDYLQNGNRYLLLYSLSRPYVPKTNYSMKQKIVIIFGLAVSFSRLLADPVLEIEPLNEEAVEEKTDFIRLDEDDMAARLQTAVTTYQKGDVLVDLIGAVHVADQVYFEALNEEFKAYEVVLFEMIGGEKMVDGAAPASDPEQKEELFSKLLGELYLIMEDFLELSGQKDHVDYSAKNFVHADLSIEEFKRLQDEKNESIIGFALKQKKPEKEPSTAKLLVAAISGNGNMAKLELIGMLAEADDQMAGFTEGSVIIDGRNIRCLEVLSEQVELGKKKLCIFYGAGHFPDMEQRLVADGYTKTHHRWVTAWDVEKPKKKVKKFHELGDAE